MFFQKKVERVIDVKKAEKELEDREDEKLEGKDKIAMAIAAILVFVPALLLVLGIFLFLIWLFFLRFLPGRGGGNRFGYPPNVTRYAAVCRPRIPLCGILFLSILHKNSLVLSILQIKNLHLFLFYAIV